jgi:hypothetical protein
MASGLSADIAIVAQSVGPYERNLISTRHGLRSQSWRNFSVYRASVMKSSVALRHAL